MNLASTTADICTDCLLTLEGVHEDPTSVTPTPMALFNNDPFIVLISPPASDDYHFSHLSCEGCGSRLEGNRYIVHVLTEVNQAWLDVHLYCDHADGICGPGYDVEEQES